MKSYPMEIPNKLIVCSLNSVRCKMKTKNYIVCGLLLTNMNRSSPTDDLHTRF